MYQQNAGDYVLIQDDPSLRFGEGDSFTYEAWYYSLSDAGEQHLMRKGDYANYATTTNYALRFQNGELFFYYYNEDNVIEAIVATTTVFLTETWNHVAVSYDGSTNRVRLFINGAEVSGYDKGSWPASPANPPYTSKDPVKKTSKLAIGTSYHSTDPDSSMLPFSGYVDEVRLSNTVRYNSSFIPSASPFVSDGNTVLPVSYTHLTLPTN